MLDKTNTIQSISLVLKRDILPNLTNDMAREQTIAILSLLKNLDANTVPNEEPYKSVNIVLRTELKSSIERMKPLITETTYDLLKKYEDEHKNLASNKKQNEREKWEALNSLLSKMITFVYQNAEFHPFIDEFRQTMRKQLDIEMKMVH